MKEKFISRIAIIISLIAIILIIETRVEYKHFPDSNIVAATTITTETTEATSTTTSTASATSVSSSKATQTTTSAQTTTTTTSATTAATSQTTTTTIVVTTAPLSPEEQAFITYKEESLKKLKGKTQLEGIDISAYQSEQDWKGYIDKADAVIMRYSYGTELDTMFSAYMEYAKSQHKLVGIYFYTNANSWRMRNPEEYADWCIESTKDYLGYAVYALDCEEAEVLDCEWILRYLRRFQERTGVKPVVYTYQALLNRSRDQQQLATIRSESYGLWIANYGQNDGSVAEFEVVKWEENKVFAHQYVSKQEHLDRDIFYCVPEAWYKFSKANKTPT